jgi:hypothetical protein
MKKTPIISEAWYDCALCASCGQALPLLQVLQDAPPGGHGSFSFSQVLCPLCGSRHDYPALGLVRYQGRYLLGESASDAGETPGRSRVQ